jgi:hypothetical protein
MAAFGIVFYAMLGGSLVTSWIVLRLRWGDIQLRRIAANILTKEPRKNDKGWFSG